MVSPWLHMILRHGGASLAGGLRPLPSVISSKHFSHAGFIGHVKDALEESAIDPQCITIELTESLAMNDVAATFQTMSQLRTLGVKLSIDDFGTGYSSLSYLRRFPVDTLKIDQSFVATMDA